MSESDSSLPQAKTEPKEEEPQQQVEEIQQASESELFDKTQLDDCVLHSQSTRKTRSEKSEELGKRLLGGEDVSILDPSDIVGVVAYLSAYRDENLKNHNVDEGERADSIVQQIQRGRKLSIKSQYAEERAKDFIARLEESREQLAHLEERIKGTSDSLQAENQRNLERLQQKHEQDMKTLVAKWQSAKNMKKYARASTTLRTIRHQSLLLMSQRRYEELRVADNIASTLEKKETEEQSRVMTREYESQLKFLTEKQQSELDVVKMAQNRRLSEVKSAGDRAIESMQKRISNLEHDLEATKDVEKFWAVYHRNEEGVLSRATQGQAKMEQSKRKRNAAITMNLKTINTLKLPPLVDPRSKKRSRSQTVSPQK